MNADPVPTRPLPPRAAAELRNPALLPGEWPIYALFTALGLVWIVVVLAVG